MSYFLRFGRMGLTGDGPQLAFEGTTTLAESFSGVAFTLVVLNNPAANPYDTFSEVLDADGIATLSGDEVTISGLDYETATTHTLGYEVTSSGDPTRPTLSLTVVITVTDVDDTAPVLSSPTDAATGETTASITVSTNEGNGTLYAVVSTSGTAPSAAQVKAGQMHTGGAAAWSGSQAVSSTGVKTFSPTGLSDGTAYTAHFMHEDASANQSTVATADGFTTDSGADFVLIDRTAGTNIGNMTVAGGLAAAFDGETNETNNNCARYNDVDGWVGKTLAAPRAFGKALVYGSNQAGYDSRPVADTNITLKIYGKNGTAPSAYNDGTLLGTTGPFVDQFDESGGRQVDSTDLSTTWDHLWVHIHTSGLGQVTFCAELILYAWE